MIYVATVTISCLAILIIEDHYSFSLVRAISNPSSTKTYSFSWLSLIIIIIVIIIIITIIIIDHLMS